MTCKSIVAVLVAVLITGCASTSDSAENTENTTSGSGNEIPAVDDAKRKTDLRLQLDRSIDQWYIHFQKQQFSTADALATSLENFVNENYDFVVSDLKTASPRFRKVAAAALGFSGKSEAVEPLVAALRDPFEPTVVSALLSLGRLALLKIAIPNDSVTPFLSHPDDDIRSNAAYVLARSTKRGDGELFLPLTTAMEDANSMVRLHAAAALGSLGDADAIPFLLKGLKDEKSLVRIRSAYALGRINERRAVRKMIDSLDDPSEDVQKAVHKALKSITGQSHPRDRNAWLVYLDNSEDSITTPFKK